MSDTQALTGKRVLDFTQVLAGPFATQQLAQLGADVIKVEQPGTGDMTRGLLASDSHGMAPSFLTCNLGKRSLTLDLKQETAREIIFNLIPTCDALVENFKPGTIERLGFGYEAVKAVKPDIVYASISGYGQEGPKSELPAFDGAIQAASGMMSVSGHPESGPVRTGYFSVDMSTALNAAFAITAALFRQHVTGEGQRVDIAMMDTAMVMLAPQMSAYLSQGTLPDLMGNRSPTKQPTANVFATADGYVQVVALKEPHIQALFKLMGHAELYERFSDPLDRVRGTEEMNEFLVPAFKSEPSAHWLKALSEQGIPAAPIMNLAGSAAEDQMSYRLSFAEVPDPNDGSQTTRVVSSGHVANPAPPAVQRPAPALGEHTGEILEELGFSKEQIRQFEAESVV